MPPWVPAGQGALSLRAAACRLSIMLVAATRVTHAQWPDTRELVMPDGDVRSYILTLPPDYDPAEAAPAVLDFHGAGSNPVQQLAYSNLTPLAARDRVILVHPNSRSSERPKVWWHGTLYLPDDDADVRFAYELVRVLAEEHGASDFFAMGMSSGGDMSSGLACQPDTPFSGFGAVTHAYYWGTNPEGSGQPGSPNYNGGSAETSLPGGPCLLDTPPPSFVTESPTTENCAHGQPRRFIYFHGTEVRNTPFLGRRFILKAEYLPRQARDKHK